MPDLVLRAAPILDLPRSLEILIEGGVHAANAALLKERLDRVLDSRTTFVLIHMGNVSYVSSSGFGYLMDLAATLERRGGALVLVDVQPKVKVIFNNLGMQSYFRFEAGAEGARAYLRAQAGRLERSPRVVPLNGPQEGVEFPLVGTSLRIGSDSRCTIVVRHPEADPRHAEVYRNGDACFLKDLGSRFGTWIGNRRVTDEPLRPGDVFRVADLRLAFRPASSRPGATGT
ncbi:MAG: STAS domain-containing protein [Planctomycetota bacterium]